MLRHFASRQFAAFLAVGGTAALLHWLARILLSLYMPFGWAVALAYGIGMGSAFALNKRYVFPASDKPVEKQARDFIVINAAFFPLVWVVAVQLNWLLQYAGMQRFTEELAHALAISLPVIGTFLLYKFIAFRENFHGSK